MKKTVALVALNAFNRKNLELKTILVLIALPLLLSRSVPPAHAADRVLQVLGKCGNADAQYDGNGKRGRSHLISFAPTGFAGFVLEGVEGLKISNLRNILVAFDPPAEGTSEFVFRVKTSTGKIQNFTIGSNNSPSLPNLPTDIVQGAPDSLQVSFQSRDLINDKSNLHPDDIIAKCSFLFSCNKKNSRQDQFISVVFYNGMLTSLVLDPVTCNLK
jgi:hypothetical protein